MPGSELQHLSDVLDSGQYSDFTIRCGHKSFAVHRAIICPQSRVLAAACSDRFKEGQIGRLDLSGNDPRAVETMIRYLYVPNYDEALAWQMRSESTAENLCENIIVHAAVYAIADQYFIVALQEAAKAKIKSELVSLRKSQTFMDVIEVLWKHKEYRGLHRMIEEVIGANIEQLLKTNAAALIEKGMTGGFFSVDLIQQLLKQKNGEIQAKETLIFWVCNDCKRMI